MFKKKIALIGNGYWGSKIAKYMSKFFKVDIVANSKFDLSIIWRDKSIDGVIIATPIGTHFEIAKAALDSGKHVFIEKPITQKRHEAVELKTIAEINNLKIGVNYIQQFSPGLKKAKEYILNNKLKINHIEAITNRLGRFMEHNVYWILASHHLSVLAMFFDLNGLHYNNTDLIYNANICSTGRISCFENYYDSFKEIATLNVSVNYSEKESKIIFYCEDCCIIYNPLSDISLTITNYNKLYKKPPKGLITTREEFKIDELNNLKYSMAYFSDLMNNRAESNIDTSIKITEIIEDLI